MKLFIIIFYFLNIFKTYTALNIVPTFLKKSPIYHEINNLLSSDNKSPFILNGDHNKLKKNLCYIIAQNNNINFKEYTFDKFMLKLPFTSSDNSLIYINDFLVKDGRVLNFYEQDLLLYLSESSKLIIFESSVLLGFESILIALLLIFFDKILLIKSFSLDLLSLLSLLSLFNKVPFGNINFNSLLTIILLLFFK